MWLLATLASFLSGTDETFTSVVGTMFCIGSEKLSLMIGSLVMWPQDALVVCLIDRCLSASLDLLSFRLKPPESLQSLVVERNLGARRSLVLVLNGVSVFCSR